MKTLLLWAACCLCFWRTASAQANWQWAKTASGFTVNDVVTDASGEALATGAFSSPVSFSSPYFSGTLTPVGLSDIMVVRYDASGNVKWARQIGGSGATAAGVSLALDGQGYAYVTGSYADAALTVNTGNTTIPYAGGTLGTGRTCLVKLSATTGWAVWGRGAGGGSSTSRDCTPADVAVTAAGTCFVTGTYGGYAQFGQLATGSSLKMTSYVAAYSSVGAVLWAISSNPVSWAYYQSQAHGNSVAADAAGNCYVSGNYSYSDFQLGGLQLSTSDASQSYVARLNPTTGQAVWLRGTTTATAPASATGYGIAVVGSNCYVGGNFSGTIAFGGSYTLLASSPRGYLASYTTASGATSWVRPLLNAGGAIQVAASLASVVAAGAVPYSGTLAAQGKLWFFEPTGVSQGSVVIGGGSSGASSKINGLGYAGTVLHVGGPFNGFCIFGNGGLATAETGPPAHYVARLTTAAQRTAHHTVAAVYPNPATEAFQVLLPAGVRSASLYNQQGHVVRQLKVTQPTIFLPVQGLRPGLYWLRWQGPDGPVSQQLQIQP
ncbi:SBBP repeat-containing protein [Hymenobacter pini]|uniref:SBBP repeat-containing protein n=1 Tax=Hymenobacter pini TaxID=2880879 RepID=UPI001CF3154E|nr:SBBP repeat-containing protein [Hymenobacter pini]MCA8832557.1 T9SS type A sorting domain-containing protein [Hymenobacter pini]